MQSRAHEGNHRAETSADQVTIPFSMHLELLIHDSDTIAELQQHPAGEQRERFATEALRIGVMALRQARGQIDADAVRREGEAILNQLQEKLDQHGQRTQDRLTNQLKEYFDPQSGRFQERIERLIRQDGELEQILKSQVGQDDSALAKTLTAHIGTDSPFMQFLDPARSEGLIALLQDLVESQLAAQRQQILAQFSLDEEEGALSRFIRELTKKQSELSGDLHEKVDVAVKQFSLDDENSALSNLVRNMKDAQRTITAEFSLDEERSALSKLKKILTETQDSIHSHLSLDDENSALARIKRELFETLKTHQDTNRDFQEEVRLTLNELNIRKAEASRGTQHGLDFEAAVATWFQCEAQNSGDIATETGTTTGQIKHCKIGDVMLELGPDSAAPGSRVVVEAKEKKQYDLKTAREEIETARKNRAAQIGVFIFSKTTAPADMEPFSRYGNDLFIIWDATDPNTDLYMKVAYSVAKALCIRTARDNATHAADFSEIDQAINEIEKRTSQLDDVETWSTTIVNNGEKILKKIKATRKSVTKQTELLREKTEAIRKELDSV